MSKYFLSLILFNIYLHHFSQAKFDTLFIGTKKFALEKTPIYESYGHGAVVALPAEYKRIHNEFLPHITMFADSAEIATCDEQSNPMLVRTPILKQEPYRHYFLPAFLDTIRIRAEEFGYQIPYIKSNKQKIVFTSANILQYINEVLTPFHILCTVYGEIFSLWDYRDIEPIKLSAAKKNIYIVRDLYYKKGTSTYHLDRQFVIVLY